jgi:FMN phosphatase YigB (HAD superfamily)
MPGMDKFVPWVASLYGIGLLSNIMPGLIKSMTEKKSIPNLAYDSIVDSSEVHAIKPDIEIFETATERAKCDKSEILLIDDSRTNLMAADAFGWKVLWFDGYRPEESIARIREALEPQEQEKAVNVESSNSLPKIFQTLPG